MAAGACRLHMIFPRASMTANPNKSNGSCRYSTRRWPDRAHPPVTPQHDAAENSIPRLVIGNNRQLTASRKFIRSTPLNIPAQRTIHNYYFVTVGFFVSIVELTAQIRLNGPLLQTGLRSASPMLFESIDAQAHGKPKRHRPLFRGPGTAKMRA